MSKNRPFNTGPVHVASTGFAKVFVPVMLAVLEIKDRKVKS